MKKRIFWLPCVVLFVLICVFFSSCELPKVKDDTIGQGYFDFFYVTTEENGEKTTVTCSVNCALPIYEYTSSLVLVNKDGKEFYESKSKTVEQEISAATDFQVVFEESTEKCREAEIFRLRISGKSKENANSLKEKDYNVKFLIGESVVSESTVKGLTNIEVPELEKKEYLTFDGWYFEPEFINKCDTDNYAIIRNTTLYGKYSFDAEKVSHRVASHVLKSTVSIRSEFYESNLSFSIDYALEGSGVIFKVYDGYAYVLTNEHVVSYEKSVKESYYVFDSHGNMYSAHLYNKAKSAEYDLAILRFRVGAVNFEPVNIAENDAKKGEVVLSIGAPNGQSNTVTYGRVIDNLKANGSVTLNFKVTYHNAIIGEGSSGGALLNGDLELVGINFAGYASEGMGNGLSVPISKVLEFVSPYFEN